MTSQKGDPNKLEEYIAGAAEGAGLATNAHQATWHLGEEDSWNIDQDLGTLVLSFANGVVATAPVQIIGTYNAQDETFMWGWDHPSVVPALQTHAQCIKKLGEKYGFEELTWQKVTCDDYRAWQYTALAMRVCKASGVYRCEPAPGTFVYMTFGEVSLKQG